MRRFSNRGPRFLTAIPLSNAGQVAFFSSGLLRSTDPLRSSFHYRKRHLGPEDAVDPLTKPTNIDKAALHVVSVPIGNLKDFSIRALDVLRDVDYIITSDRPATKTLLDLVHIPNQGRLIHYSRTNQSASRDKLVEMLKGGRSMAFVTTSGTPCVGDVGGELVQEMQRNGIRVTAVPGPSAVMSALAVSGLTTSPFESANHSRDRGEDADEGNDQRHRGLLHGLQDGSFFFGNMLPDSHGDRLRLLRTIVAPATYPCVFYEIPRRLLATLQDIAAIMPTRRVYVTHELTKLNESLHADTAEQLTAFYLRQEAQEMLKKGQLVLVVDGAGPKEMAAWLEKESAKRRRLRKDVDSMMKTRGPSSEAEQSESSPETPPPSLKQRRRSARQLRLRRRREKLIQQIEQEQARLQLNMSIHRNDASREFFKKD